MIHSCEIVDTYHDGRWLRRWSLVAGRARCLDDAYEVAVTAPAVLDAQRAANALVRDTLAAVEAYEAALALVRLEEPPFEIVGSDDGGATVANPNPAWAAWDAARRAVAVAAPDTVALHGQRTAE